MLRSGRGRFRRRPAETSDRPSGRSSWTPRPTADAAQALRVGCYELRHRGELKHAGLFYEPASLSQAETELLSAYAAARGLRVWTRDEFAEEVFLKAAWELRALIVGHNLPFDLARISIGCRPCQSRNRSMRGGFTLQISENTKLSRVQVKKTNAGAAFIRQRSLRGSVPRSEVGSAEVRRQTTTGTFSIQRPWVVRCSAAVQRSRPSQRSCALRHKRARPITVRSSTRAISAISVMTFGSRGSAGLSLSVATPTTRYRRHRGRSTARPGSARLTSRR